MTISTAILLRGSRLIEALAALSVLLGGVLAGPRLDAAAVVLAAADASGARWVVNPDESQPAKIERGAALQNQKAAPAPAPPALLAARSRAPKGALLPPAPAWPARDAPDERAAHSRPSPTGPPALG